MLKLTDFDYHGKTVLFRADLNSPIENGHITSDARFRAILPTLKYLLEQDAKVVVATHQGRPYSNDFSTTEEHARVLGELIGRKVEYVEDIFGKYARDRIRTMEPGEVIMLENLRFASEEVKYVPLEKSEHSFLVRKLAEVVDFVVNDAFATAHRSAASLVGFARLKPLIPGFLMSRELEALKHAYESTDQPRVYVLGGAKVDDSLRVAENVLKAGRADVILTGGLVGHIFTLAKGYDLGDANIEFLERRGLIELVDHAERILNDFYPYVRTPVDFAVEVDGRRVEVDLLSDEKVLFDKYPILDIGSRTVEKYTEILNSASIIVANGPMGVFEREEFALGTVGVFRAIGASEAFSVVGGGHSIAGIYRYGIEGISHISTGGGAMLEFFAGKELPLLRAFEVSAEHFGGKA